VAQIAAQLVRAGCREVSLGDTIGVGTPETVTAILRAVLDEVPASQIACHFHDTNGRALSCVEAALDLGLGVFDASVGGAGGCPYAPGSPGNVATGAVARLLAAKGFRTGIDPAALAKAEALILHLLGRAA
jgi:hydroxymethylglutaryl-CoA lyase